MAAAGGNGAGAGGAPPVVVRLGRETDAAAVAHLHAEQIGEGFLSSLGPRFLEQLYRRIAHDEGSFLLVAERHGTLAGFVAGTTALRRLYAAFLRRDGLRVLAGSPWRLVTSWRRVVETLRHGRTDTGPPADGELLAIAVDPTQRGRGIGAELVHALLGEMARRGAVSVDVVVGADNAAAIALYTSTGFAPLRRFELHAGTESLTLRHTAMASSPGAEGAAP
ncbi:MAG TPA: GNAT family N-acetyltransferase [Acidimicrobiales bacterium]|nr:GNAT family N-acetyltransferase [Acidimicrobiales bacterium]